jgi:hypothetical protein
MGFAKAKYTGATPGADSNDYTLFNSITAGLPGNWPALHGVFKVVVDIKHTQAGTLKWYKTDSDPTDASDSAVTWSQMGQLSVSAPASTDGTQAEVFCEAEKHVKVLWTNGGVAQASWIVDISFSNQRAAI